MSLTTLFKRQPLDEIFTPGGQPSVTYVKREHLGLEANVKKAIALPNTVVSLTGPTKSGKTVLCKTVLMERSQFVWIDGGQVASEDDIWSVVCTELNLASEFTDSDTTSGEVKSGLSGEASFGLPGNHLKLGVTEGGSALATTQHIKKHLPNNRHQAIEFLTDKRICLVIDDFHYIPEEIRASLIRTLKGPVFRGLKVILLSTPHRAFDALKAESEVTGRFKHVTVPAWSDADLKLIAETGFKALNVAAEDTIVTQLAREAEGSPLLVQRFCWTLCYDAGIVESALFSRKIPPRPLGTLFNEVAEDAGLPIYSRLAKGPQSRTDRIRRPLIEGGTVDIYEAILLAIARTGPKERLTYDQIRSSLNSILSDKIPQKNEVSNALNHLAAIATEENHAQRALDWDTDNLDLVITDPFFRFYLRWKVSGRGTAGPGRV